MRQRLGNRPWPLLEAPPSLLGFFSSFLNSELNGVDGGPTAQVVHTCFRPCLMGIEMYGTELGKVGVFHVDVEALPLIDIRFPPLGHVDDKSVA